MNQELQDKLFNAFPRLFKQKDFPKEKSAMCWGIDCPDEWYDTLYKLCECIQQYCNTLKKEDQVEFTQIKSKFGKLCVYTNSHLSVVNGMIRFASHLLSDKKFSLTKY